MTTDEKLQMLARAILNLGALTRQVYTDDDGVVQISGRLTDYADISLIEALQAIAE